MEKSKIWLLYKWILFIGSLYSFKAYFFWGIPDVIVQLIFIASGILTYMFIPYLFSVGKKKIVWFLLLLLASILTSTHMNLNGMINSVLRIIPLFFIIALKSRYKKDLFLSIRLWFAIFLSVSLVGWILYLSNINFSYSIVYYGKIDGLYQYIFKNYYLFLVNLNSIYDYYRFSSVFLEPGYLGCLLSVFLFLGQYKWNKINIVFLICLLFTFSLAGWLITTFIYLLCRLKKSILWLISIVLFALLITNFVKSYNQGDNWLNNAIFARLEYDEGKGIRGYNRSNEYTDKWFWDQFVHSKDLFWGRGSAFEFSSTDWKVYIVLYGLFSLIAYLVYLLFPLFSSQYNKYRLVLFSLIYLLIFAQTIHGIFWFFYLFMYILGVGVITNRENNQYC